MALSVSMGCVVLPEAMCIDSEASFPGSYQHQLPQKSHTGTIVPCKEPLSRMRMRVRETSVMVTSMAGSLLVFWWYWADSTSRSYRRSPLLNVAVVAIGFLAVPYYLVRSRESGKRLPALAKMVGYLVLIVAAMVIGALPFALLG